MSYPSFPFWQQTRFLRYRTAYLFAAILLFTSIMLTFSFYKQVVPHAHAAGEQAKSADSFVDSFGVNTHLNYTDTAYGQYDSLIKPKLQELGVRHIRDGGTSPTFINQLKDLAGVGIRSDLIFLDPPSVALQTVKNASGAVDAVEGPNETDLDQNHFSYNGQPFPEGTRAYQNDLYAIMKGDPQTKDLPVILPSMGWGKNAERMGYLDAGDIGNMHSYPGTGLSPTDAIDWWFLPYGRTIAGDTKPLWSTETGYYTMVDGNRGVTESVTGKFMPRLWLEQFNRGVQRVYQYEFIDESPDPQNTDSERHYGLLHNDGTAKPSYTAIKNMLHLLADPGTSFTPGSLDYTLNGDGDMSTIHHTLLQKRDGTFDLILWQDFMSWDTTNRKDISTPDRTVTLTLNTPITGAKTYLPLNSADVINTYDHPTNITLAVPDHPLIVELSSN